MQPSDSPVPKDDRSSIENLGNRTIRCVPCRDPRKFLDPSFVANNRVYFKFLDQGAANTVFRIEPYSMEQSEGYPSIFIGNDGKVFPRAAFLTQVLRITKGKPKTLSGGHILDGFEDEIQPLFRYGYMHSHYLQNAVIDIPPSEFADFLMHHGIVIVARSVLRHLVSIHPDGLPPSSELNLDESVKGILLPDMSSIDGSALMFEIKPKWLLQSPNAPRDAFRCRTCALHASRMAKVKVDLGEGFYICPLKLVAGNSQAIELHIKYQIDQAREELPPEVAAVVLRRTVLYLTTGPGHKLLKYMRALQAQLDPLGALGKDEVPSDEIPEYYRRLRLAMTLRDCSLFIRIPHADESQPIEAKLGDLDFKSIDKVPDWEEKEVKLINGGWYTNLQVGVRECLIAEAWKHSVPHYM